MAFTFKNQTLKKKSKSYVCLEDVMKRLLQLKQTDNLTINTILVV